MSIPHGGTAALVLDPIVDGFHLTRVLMDGGTNLNLIYTDTVKKMHIDPARCHDPPFQAYGLRVFLCQTLDRIIGIHGNDVVSYTNASFITSHDPESK